MIFQDPMTSLNPLMKIGKQITEPLKAHLGLRGKDAEETAVRLLTDVRIPEARRRIKQYPHELSGGMRQRVMIAIALACGPALLFADEPTTALDVTVQSQILDLIGVQRRERNMSVILVTHDLGVVAGHTDEIAVMYGGRIVEQAPTRSLFAHMKMPYTEALLASIPKLEDPSHTRLTTIAGRPPDLVNPPRRLPVRAALRLRPRPLPRGGAAADAGRPTRATRTPAGTRSARPSTTSGGPSSATRRRRPPRAWSTSSPRRRPTRPAAADGAARVEVGLMAGTGKAHLSDGDDVLLARRGPRRRVPGRAHRARRQRRVGHQHRRAQGRDARPRRRVGLRQEHDRAGDHAAAPARRRAPCASRARSSRACRRNDMREARTRMQMIFQDPISSLNPRRKVRDIVMEPLKIWNRGGKPERSRRSSTSLLEEVGIDPQRAGESQPHQFSGGQCQRISIARSLVLDPSLIICDEPVSALDVSVQAQVLNLLEDLKAKHGLTLIFIAHDLAVVKNISDRVAVMYLGKLCEIAPSDELYRAPMHPYTNVLLDSIPVPDPDAPVTATEIDRRAALPGAAAAGLPVPHPLPAGRPTSAARSSPRSARSAPGTSSPATTRSSAASSPRCPSPSAPPSHARRPSRDARAPARHPFVYAGGPLLEERGHRLAVVAGGAGHDLLAVLEVDRRLHARGSPAPSTCPPW